MRSHSIGVVLLWRRWRSLPRVAAAATGSDRDQLLQPVSGHARRPADCRERSSCQASRSSGWQPSRSAGLAPLAFLAGLLDARLAKASVGELLVQLRASPAPDLQELLAQALRDPTLSLIYWLPQYGSWADQNGNPDDASRARQRTPGYRR